MGIILGILKLLSILELLKNNWGIMEHKTYDKVAIK